MIAQHSGKALDVRANNQTEGGEIIQFTINGTSAQQWSIEARTCVNTIPTFDDTKCYKIISRNSGKVLGVTNGLTASNTVIKQYTYADKAWQQWKIQSVGNGLVKFLAGHTGKCIDVPGSSTQDGVQLIQWPYSGTPNEQWSISRNTSGYYVITANHSGKVIDVKGNSNKEGSDIIQSTLNGGTNQQWSITEATCVASGGRTSSEFTPIAAAATAENSSDGFKLWPNPATDHVLIDLRPAGTQPVDILLTDLNGRSKGACFRSGTL